MATVSDVARVFAVPPDTIKAWTREFAEHLSAAAVPPKGQERQFTEADLRVIALIAEHADVVDEPDDIHCMLNQDRQLEERFMEFARLHTPLFQDVPDDIEESAAHGTLLGGMADRQPIDVARAYKRAADLLAAAAKSEHEPHELDYPLLFLYRHAIELYLKAILKERAPTHDLNTLIERLEAQYGAQIAKWVGKRLRDFHEIDRRSDMFRYAQSISGGEVWIDFHHLQLVIDRLVEAFEKQIP